MTEASAERRPILVTGGAGFIGSNLADRLAGQGHDVLIYDALARPGVEANLAWLRRRHPGTGVLVFSLMIGALVTQVGYTPFFICLGVLDLVGAVVLWTVVREPRPASTPVPAT